jgi:hypothetical protein
MMTLQPFANVPIFTTRLAPALGDQSVAGQRAAPRMLQHPGESLKRHLPRLERHEAVVLEDQRHGIAVADLELLANFRRQDESAPIRDCDVKDR